MINRLPNQKMTSTKFKARKAYLTRVRHHHKVSWQKLVKNKKVLT